MRSYFIFLQINREEKVQITVKTFTLTINNRYINNPVRLQCISALYDGIIKFTTSEIYLRVKRV